MMRIVICYKETIPTVYNKGTKWEKTCDTFLSHYTCKTREEAQAECDLINSTKPEKLFNGQPAMCENRTYFVSEQEDMY